MRSYCLCPSDAEWEAVLSGNRYDIYHRPEYLAVDAQLTNGEAVGICIEEDPLCLLVPLVLEPLPEYSNSSPLLKDAHSPYGYGSPLVLTAPDAPLNSEQDREAFLARAVPKFVETLRALNVVSAFIRLHPLLPIPLGPLSQAGEVVDRGQTVSVDLTLSDEELERQLRKDHRRDIRKLEQAGYTASIEADLTEFDTFRDIYTESMNRLHASAYYYFNDEYFRALREDLASYVRLGAVRYHDTVISMDIVTEINGIVQGHLRGTRTEHIKASPTKALTVETQRWAKKRGNSVFHLGGGIGTGEQRKQLMLYKLGFSARTHQYRTWHLIVQPNQYSYLAEQWERLNLAKHVEEPGHFPVYRTPTRV